MLYRRSDVVAAGRELDRQDRESGRFHRGMGGQLAGAVKGYQMGGAPQPPAQMPPGYSNFAANAIFSAPFLGLQIPQFVGPGGYSKPATQNTPPGQIAMAMQPHAQGGQVDDSALARAARILHEAKLACGGAVHRAEGGHIGGEPMNLRLPGRSPQDLLALWERVDRENLHVHPDRVFSYVLQRSPDLRREFRDLLSRGFSREAARVTMHNELVHAAKNANE